MTPEQIKWSEVCEADWKRLASRADTDETREQFADGGTFHNLFNHAWNLGFEKALIQARLEVENRGLKRRPDPSQN